MAGVNISVSSNLHYDENLLPSTAALADWLNHVAQTEGKLIEEVAYNLVSDEFLLELNREFLDHDELTDILTFPYNYDPIRAEIFISVERVVENAGLYKVSASEEMLRVLVHGILHMCGFTDKTNSEKADMRKKEAHYIKAFKARMGK